MQEVLADASAGAVAGPDPADAEWSSWARLGDELARWSPQSAVFWWRDDDAVTATPALDTLLSIARGVPITLAVVPKLADAALGRRLERPDAQAVTVVQHGWSHRDHGRGRKAELGAERPADVVLRELDLGRERLQSLYGPRFARVLVPPWNRIDPSLLPLLTGRYRGLSTDRPRARRQAAAGVVQANAHVDLIDWRAGGVFAGTAVVLEAITAHLAGRREHKLDVAEETGILTHHLVQDVATWHFLRRLLAFLDQQRTVRWASTHEVFGLP